MQWFVILGENGSQRFDCRADGERLPEGAVVVPRAPENGEIWDMKASAPEAAGTTSGAFARDAEVAADMAVSAGHKGEAHLIKGIEASLVLSGIALTHGLLAEEAAATGKKIEDLATEVAAKRRAFLDAETNRRTVKHAAREKDK